MMDRLPDSTGMKNEIIIHKSHRFPYDQCYTSVGAKFVEIGDGRRCQPWQLEAAFTENTAAVAYLFSPFITRRAIPFPEVCEIAHSHGVPVIVDAASMLPPRSNLRRFTAEGADMVIYSGGKAVRGPQGTGILCGREDLIDAAFANAAPHQFIGRRNEGRQRGDSRAAAGDRAVRERGRRGGDGAVHEHGAEGGGTRLQRSRDCA